MDELADEAARRKAEAAPKQGAAHQRSVSAVQQALREIATPPAVAGNDYASIMARLKRWEAGGDRMKRTLHLLPLLTLALAGCAGAPVERIVKVDTPVPMPCDVKTPQKAAMPLDALKAPYTGDQWTASAIAERKMRLAYEGELKPPWRRAPRR